MLAGADPLSKTHAIGALLVLALAGGSGCAGWTGGDPKQVPWEPVASYPSPLKHPAYGPIESDLSRRLVGRNVRYLAFGKTQRTFCVPQNRAEQTRKWLAEWVAVEGWSIQILGPEPGSR